MFDDDEVEEFYEGFKDHFLPKCFVFHLNYLMLTEFIFVTSLSDLIKANSPEAYQK